MGKARDDRRCPFAGLFGDYDTGCECIRPTNRQLAVFIVKKFRDRGPYIFEARLSQLYQGRTRDESLTSKLLDGDTSPNTVPGPGIGNCALCLCHRRLMAKAV